MINENSWDIPSPEVIQANIEALKQSTRDILIARGIENPTDEMIEEEIALMIKAHGPAVITRQEMPDKPAPPDRKKYIRIVLLVVIVAVIAISIYQSNE